MLQGLLKNKNADASDVLIGGALLGLGLAVAMKTDIWTGLGVLSAALLGLIALGMVTSR